MKNEGYTNYITSPRWFYVRTLAFKLFGKACQRCGVKRKLHVHHKTYERFAHENVETDLAILCTKCHDTYHSYYGSTSVTTTSDFIKNGLPKEVSNTKKKFFARKEKKAEKKKARKGLRDEIRFVASLNRKRISRIKIHDPSKVKKVDLLEL